MVLPWINLGPSPKWLSVDRVIETYAEKTGGLVRFLGEVTVRTPHGRDGPDTFSTTPVAVFWQERISNPEHSHYFGLFHGRSGLHITNAACVAEGIWRGAMHSATGEVVFSRYRHDMRGPEDGSFHVDGGRDYLKMSGKRLGVPVTLAVNDGWWTIVEMHLNLNPEGHT